MKKTAICRMAKREIGNPLITPYYSRAPNGAPAASQRSDHGWNDGVITGYIRDLQKAYRQHYNAKNMKPATVRKRAAELLHNGVVAGFIRDLQKKHRQRHDVTMDGLVDELEPDKT